MEPAQRIADFLTPAPPVRRVVVATDFSPGGTRALSWAVEYAAQVGAEVHVLHVTARSETDAWSPMRLASEGKVPGSKLADGVEEQLREQIVRHATSGVVIRPATAYGTAVAPTIAEVAAERHADLVVVGTHGRRGVRRLMLGSVAEEVVRTAMQPVVVVPPEVERGRPEVQRILMPIDFSGFSLNVLPWARGFAQTFGAELVLLHVIESYSLAEVYGLEAVLVSGAHPSMKALAHEMAERMQRDLTTVGVDASVHLDEGHAATAIPQFARSYGADLIVMASHGRTGLQRFLLGSVAARVLRTAPCPTLIVRSDVEDEDVA